MLTTPQLFEFQRSNNTGPTTAALFISLRSNSTEPTGAELSEPLRSNNTGPTAAERRPARQTIYLAIPIIVFTAFLPLSFCASVCCL